MHVSLGVREEEMIFLTERGWNVPGFRGDLSREKERERERKREEADVHTY